MNLMLINVSTRKFGRAVRLPEGDVPAPKGAGVSKSAVSRRFVALSAERMKEWMATDLSKLDLLVIQIDGLHMDDDLIEDRSQSAAPPHAGLNPRSAPHGEPVHIAPSPSSLRPPPHRQKAICCRIFTPAQPEDPAASVRDYCYGAYTPCRRR